MKLIPLSIIALSSVAGFADDNLWNRFLTPPDECKTKLWWFHGETETTEEGIRLDLEEFKDKGIGGVVFYDQVHGNADGASPSMSPEWWQSLKYAAKTAGELGLSFEVAVGNGYVAGGPYITPDLAMKKTVFIDTLLNIDNPRRISISRNLANYHDIASIMFQDNEALSPINLELQPIKLSPGDSTIYIDLGNIETLRGISYTVTPRGKGSTASMNIPGAPSDRYFAAKYVEYPPIGELEISDDLQNWTKCCDLLPIENTIGFKSRQRTISFPQTSGRHLRIRLHEEVKDDESYKPITLSDIRLMRRDVIDNVEVKTGLRTEVTYPSETGGEYGSISSDRLINITDSIDSDGILNITLPKGTWRVIRFGYVPTGAKTKHGRKNLLGYEADVMSREAAGLQYDYYFKTILDTLGIIGCRPVGMCMDSHEAGCQNWTYGLENKFHDSNVYSIIPYIPVFAGYIVDSRHDSEKTLHDFRRTVAQTISSEFYGTFAERAHEDGVVFTSQAMLNILTDNIANRSHATKPQGEFWAYQKDGNYDCLDAASAAHIYGRNIASGEAFTDTPYDEPWDELLRIANVAYSRGINEFAVCASTYQPWLDHRYDDSASAHPYVFHRHHPDWNGSKDFWDYQSRCAMMLREGSPAVDLAVYIGEEPPLKTFSYKLPVMPEGYNFDVFTIDALLNRMHPENGMVAVDGGMRYNAIIVQDRTYISPEAERKLNQLKDSGIPVIRCDRGKNVETELKGYGILPDIQTDMKLHFFHRSTPDREIYFVYNHSDSVFENAVKLRSMTDSGDVELWNPMDASKETIVPKDGFINLRLNPGQAMFLVYKP